MTIETSFRHFCRGLMLGIGLIPAIVYLREGTFYATFQSQAAVLVAAVITCGVLGCIWIPSIKRFAVYWFIERPLVQEINTRKGNSQQLLTDIKLTLEHAYLARYIDKAQYQELHDTLFEQAASRFSNF